MELPKQYNARAVEGRIYKSWIDAGYFHAEIDRSKKPYTIVIPPPNVTGQLHMGHALDNTPQDILIRMRRMQGYCALWVPGTDHAGIATQIKVEENLREENKTRFDLGREAFLELVWDWKEKHGSRIIEQLKKLGCSCDWDRERFTMDPGCARAVREVFVDLYNKGLIYKGRKIINWCPDCTTALSDTEVEHEEQAGHFWHIKYPVKGADEFVTIATTRPETMLGDTAVAVNPDDARYKHLIGKTLILPLLGREIPVVADDYVDPEFGTGCVKITPCHDPNDFEVAKRHDLPHVLIMDEHANINENGGKYRGLSRYDARLAVLEDLKLAGLLVKTEDHGHNVGKCYRCGTTVEPISSEQWFVKMKPLAEPAIKAVLDGTIKFVPERFSKTYLNWMENVHDWCISRQLWWGHRIPAFYCRDCGKMTVSKHDPEKCEHCGGALRQDEDVLDTWFSSALWPFSTLGWPEKTPELDYFYPTSVLCCGYEIIFFWVARMIFSGLENMGREPFTTVVLHGIMRDSKGRKMSKSLGNGVDPIEVIDEYGADAMRFAIMTGNTPGADMRFNTERCEAMRNFCNKVWNASRFVLMNLSIDDIKLPADLRLEDKWILTRYNKLILEVTENLEKFEIGIAASKLYDFIWDDFCDWYIEITKPRLLDGGDKTAQKVLAHVLEGTMRLMHPFMPFITEEIWQTLTNGIKGDFAPSIMVARWPEYQKELDFEPEEEKLTNVCDAIRAVRARRAELSVPPSKKARLIVVTKLLDAFSESEAFLLRMAGASELTVTDEAPESVSGMLVAMTGAAQMLMPLAELVDVEKERAKLGKELEKSKAECAALEKKLGNPGFTAKAPPEVVDNERRRFETLSELIQKLEKGLDALN